MLDEQLRQLTEELKTKSQEAKAKTPSHSKLAQLKNQIQRLEHKLELAQSRTSKTQADNAELRRVIDSYRQDKYNRKHMIGVISQDIFKHSHKAENHYNSYVEGQRQDDLQKSRIYQLRSVSQNEHMRKNERIEELNSLIKEDRVSKGIFIRNIEQSFNAQLKKNTDTMDPTQVLKKLQYKWGNAVKEKKRQLDAYAKNVKMLGEAVEQIKEATGMPSIEEMTTTFIKSEDQHYSIGTYLNNLHAEVEVMEENLRNLEIAIRSRTKHSHSTEIEVNELLVKLKAKCDKMLESYERNRSEEEALKTDLESVKQPIINLLNLFDQSAFEINISIVQPSAEEELIGDDKLLLKLGELEELITNLQIFLAMKNGEGSPTLVPLDLSSIPERHHSHGGRLVPNSEIRSLMDLLNDVDEDSRTPLKIDQFRERARSRLSSKSILPTQKSFRSWESRSLTPQPFSKAHIGVRDSSQH